MEIKFIIENKNIFLFEIIKTKEKKIENKCQSFNKTSPSSPEIMTNCFNSEFFTFVEIVFEIIFKKIFNLIFISKFYFSITFLSNCSMELKICRHQVVRLVIKFFFIYIIFLYSIKNKKNYFRNILSVKKDFLKSTKNKV